MKKTKNIFELLYMIKKHPGAFLGSPSIISMNFFLLGICYASELFEANYMINEFNNFQKWLKVKYNDTSHWCSFLHKKYGDSEKAFDIFFIELSNFLKGNGIEEPHIE